MPVAPATAGGTELRLFDNSAGEDGAEFGVKAFFMIEEAPRVKHFDGHSGTGFRGSVSEPPLIVVFVGSQPGRGYDRPDAPKAAGPKPN